MTNFLISLIEISWTWTMLLAIAGAVALWFNHLDFFVVFALAIIGGKVAAIHGYLYDN